LGQTLILTKLAYSQAVERETDAHAVKMLQSHRIAPQRLADILQRQAPLHTGGHAYLATHPPTPERARAILGHAPWLPLRVKLL